MAACSATDATEHMETDEQEPKQRISVATTELFQSQLTSAAGAESATLAESDRLAQELAHTRRELELLQTKPRDTIEESELDTLCLINIANKEEIENARLEIQTLRITNEQLQSEQNRLTGDLLTKNVEIDELKKELANTREKSAYDLAGATTKIQSQADKIENLIKELRNFTWTINTGEEKLKELNRQMTLSAQRHENEMKKYSEIVRARDGTIKELDAYNADLEKQLTVIKKNLDLSEKEVAEFQLKNECLQSQTETIRLIQEANIVQSRSFTSLHEDLARLNIDKEKILRKNDEFQNQLKIKKDELSIEKAKTNKNKPEIDSLKKEIHSNKEALHNERHKWNTEKQKLEQMCSSAKEDTNQITHAFNTINQEYNTVKETLRKTVDERDELTMRLSKLASASLTHNNPNIADLSDPNRPTKLSEAFSELYDNEWTDAFEGIKDSDDRTTVNGLLTMLQKAYEFSITLTEQATKEMGGTFTHLSLKYKIGSKEKAIHSNPYRNAETQIADTTEQRDTSETIIYDKSKACPEHAKHVKSDCDAIGDTGSSLSLDKENTESNTILMADPRHHEVTAEQALPVVEYKTDMTYPTHLCTQDDELHVKDTNRNMPAHVDMAVQVDVDEIEVGTYVATVSFDLNKLNPNEKQTIKDIRKRVLHDLKDQSIPMIANAVVEEMNLQGCDDSILTYVKTCASICWEMRIHQPPVCLDFKDIDDRTLFNTSIYKHYTKSGPNVDYVVWPAMYLNEGGPLLSKGVAQGK
ncbi:uncharacterized protein LOC127866794 isoform X4 [Dreissena polymorpha]|uniref:uncharacterized protein LOC127866794 isoform X4 n=1 Tax=Dreissena polymorpha TaxID=45954 RepID=UPI002263C9CC|nr:uncharacterized protein LOC127866794 isoform X4 [Dreissena polymorpha]